jgi:hypothetical protein
MTMFAVPADETGSPVHVEPMSDVFRFSDTNPVTGRPYTRSQWADLPEFVAHVIEHQLNFCGGEWNVLVEDDEVAEFVRVDRQYSIKQWLAGQAMRQKNHKNRKPRKNTCEDCQGSGVVFDTHGYITGTPGAPMTCVCMPKPPRKRAQVTYTGYCPPMKGMENVPGWGL